MAAVEDTPHLGAELKVCLEMLLCTVLCALLLTPTCDVYRIHTRSLLLGYGIDLHLPANAG